MQVTVTDYKLSVPGKKITVDTDNIASIFSGNGVYDGRSMQGWNVVLRADARGGFTTAFVNNEDVKLLRTVK